MGDMSERQASFEAADIVIWITSCILAALIGVGISFALWMRLHATGTTFGLSVALAALAVGTLLVGLALRRILLRAFVMILGLTVVLAYVFGSPSFARLIGP
jgi:hypothetical protein